jgi:hypothetical protein
LPSRLFPHFFSVYISNFLNTVRKVTLKLSFELLAISGQLYHP